MPKSRPRWARVCARRHSLDWHRSTLMSFVFCRVCKVLWSDEQLCQYGALFGGHA